MSLTGFRFALLKLQQTRRNTVIERQNMSLVPIKLTESSLCLNLPLLRAAAVRESEEREEDVEAGKSSDDEVISGM